MPAIPSLFRINRIDLRVLPMRTRFPFRYGIASLIALPHLFVTVELEVNGQVVVGRTSEGLPPKWFTKDPTTPNELDVAGMLAVIQNAVRLASLHGREPVTWYPLVRQLAAEQKLWASRHEHPALLWNLGISLVERALLDALCRVWQLPLHEALRTPALGIRWSELHPSLSDAEVPGFLAHPPPRQIALRHTVGLADPLTAGDVPSGEAVHDGLPHTLDDCIRAYGLRYFKIKLSGNLEADRHRLTAVASVIRQHASPDFSATLDGNENFRDLAAFREWFEALNNDAELKGFMSHVLWIEQPLHRDSALNPDLSSDFREWPEAPRLIIDESDGESGALQTALDLGYSGGSHKNCKGILKGLANAAAIHASRLAHPDREFILSGEDLANVGPIPLTQDLAMQALLGITHVERNGHHYFRGLSMYPDEMGVSAATLAAHPDLYHQLPDGLVTLKVTDGFIAIDSVNQAPFGTPVAPLVDRLPTVKEWILQGGLGALEE